jgi:hypothetical protein
MLQQSIHCCTFQSIPLAAKGLSDHTNSNRIPQRIVRDLAVEGSGADVAMPHQFMNGAHPHAFGVETRRERPSPRM